VAVIKESLGATIRGLGTHISPDTYIQVPSTQSRAYASMAHCGWLRALCFVGVVNMADVETGLRDNGEGKGQEKIERRRLRKRERHHF